MLTYQNYTDMMHNVVNCYQMRQLARGTAQDTLLGLVRMTVHYFPENEKAAFALYKELFDFL